MAKSASSPDRADGGEVKLVLDANVALDLMTANPISITEKMTVKEAAAFFTDSEISAAPVINDAGRPIGVLSRTDIVRYERERLDHLPLTSMYWGEERGGKKGGEELDKEGFEIEVTDTTLVSEIMTPTVIAVGPKTPAVQIIAQLLAFKIHRLFVIDDRGVLIGVISALDIMRHLKLKQ